jgi:GLPGLI family protein
MICYHSAVAQQTFILKGKIEFEKKVNLHKQFEENDMWTDAIKKSIPQYQSAYFDLFFDSTRTLYKPGREVTQVRNNWFGSSPANENIVFNDVANATTNTQKIVFEETFLIVDSLRHLDWKITNDTRTIAGFECRKATAIMWDTIFVVAFYSEQIPVSSGPESFNGLPGLILGLALPKMNVTWFATKLELVNVTENNLNPPKKGKKTTNKALIGLLDKNLESWGSWKQKNIQQIML